MQKLYVDYQKEKHRRLTFWLCLYKRKVSKYIIKEKRFGRRFIYIFDNKILRKKRSDSWVKYKNLWKLKSRWWDKVVVAQKISSRFWLNFNIRKKVKKAPKWALAKKRFWYKNKKTFLLKKYSRGKKYWRFNKKVVLYRTFFRPIFFKYRFNKLCTVSQSKPLIMPLLLAYKNDTSVFRPNISGDIVNGEFINTLLQEEDGRLYGLLGLEKYLGGRDKISFVYWKMKRKLQVMINHNLSYKSLVFKNRLVPVSKVIFNEKVKKLALLKTFLSSYLVKRVKIGLLRKIFWKNNLRGANGKKRYARCYSKRVKKFSVAGRLRKVIKARNIFVKKTVNNFFLTLTRFNGEVICTSSFGKAKVFSKKKRRSFDAIKALVKCFVSAVRLAKVKRGFFNIYFVKKIRKFLRTELFFKFSRRRFKILRFIKIRSKAHNGIKKKKMRRI